MGCDGGSIPRRDEMVKVKKKAEKAGKEAELAATWKHCALSGEKLKKPIVACELGRLYNKESLLLALLDKPSLPEVASHIRSLRDVVELNLTPNPVYKPTAMAMEANQSAEFVCPISDLEMSGRHKFVFLLNCGCVLSERALKEAPSETCHKCGRGYSKESVIQVNGSEGEVKKLREVMGERRIRAKQEKAAKGKRKKTEPEASSTTSSSSSSSSSSPPLEDGTTGPAKKKPKIAKQDDLSSLTPNVTPISITSTTTTTAPSSTVGPAKPKKHGTTLPIGASKYTRQTNTPANPSSQIGTKLGLGSTATAVVKKTNEELGASFKSPGSDPTARDAYKSLFQSACETRPKEKTSNWVTFFPYH